LFRFEVDIIPPISHTHAFHPSLKGYKKFKMVPKIKPMILWKLQSNKRKGTILVRKRWGKVDDLVKSPEARHCEERSDEAIS
jgi:hypothetical protein